MRPGGEARIDKPFRNLEATSADLLGRIEGGADLLSWFGRLHIFHDAEARLLPIHGDGVTLTIDTWRMTDRVNADGYFENDLHCEVTLHLANVRRVQLHSDWGASAIIDMLEMRQDSALYVVEWESSYGPYGLITAEQLRLELRPGDRRAMGRR